MGGDRLSPVEDGPRPSTVIHHVSDAFTTKVFTWEQENVIDKFIQRSKSWLIYRAELFYSHLCALFSFVRSILCSIIRDGGKYSTAHSACAKRA